MCDLCAQLGNVDLIKCGSLICSVLELECLVSTCIRTFLGVHYANMAILLAIVDLDTIE